ETPEVATEALLRHQSLPTFIWEPACGRGRIVNVLRNAGHVVLASDLVNYQVPITTHWGWDFLLETKVPLHTQAFVTNPPFRLAEAFVAHALDLCPFVVMLLRWAFYESDRRSYILEGRGLARILCFRKRLPMMHRDGWEGRRANSGMAFAWYIWRREHTGATEGERVCWER